MEVKLELIDRQNKENLYRNFNNLLNFYLVLAMKKNGIATNPFWGIVVGLKGVA